MESAHRCVCKLPLVSAFIVVSKMCEITPVCISLFKPQHILYSYATRRLPSTSCRPQLRHLAWGARMACARASASPAAAVVEAANLLARDVGRHDLDGREAANLVTHARELHRVVACGYCRCEELRVLYSRSQCPRLQGLPGRKCCTACACDSKWIVRPTLKKTPLPGCAYIHVAVDSVRRTTLPLQCVTSTTALPGWAAHCP